jgi:hypothetical protein
LSGENTAYSEAFLDFRACGVVSTTSLLEGCAFPPTAQEIMIRVLLPCLACSAAGLTFLADVHLSSPMAAFPTPVVGIGILTFLCDSYYSHYLSQRFAHFNS